MGFSDDNGSAMFNMPVAPAYAGGNGNGFGFGGDWAWIILLLLLGWGNNGWGGNGFDGGAGLYPWMNNSQNINDGFRDQMISGNINSIRDSIGGISTQLCNGFAGVNAGVAGGFASAEIAANSRQMASMNQNFGLQTAMMQGFNDVGMQFANCCCENRLGIANLGSDIAREACATRTNDTQNTQAILNVVNGGIQSIKDQLCQDKIDAKNDTINQLRSELMYARGQASQDVQTAAIQAGQRALANEVEQYVAPTPRPAYVVPNPACCNNTGCGCGSF